MHLVYVMRGSDTGGEQKEARFRGEASGEGRPEKRSLLMRQTGLSHGDMAKEGTRALSGGGREDEHWRAKPKEGA